MIKSYSAEEQEVHLWFDPIDKIWRADSSVPKFIRAFQRAGWKQTGSQISNKGNEIYGSFEAPPYAISIRKAERKKRVMTDEQRAAAAERLSLARNSLKNSEKTE